MPEFWIFLSSGLFLGWSLGANDGSNVFGTAVGTRMVKFRTAAVISSVFVIIGAVFAGGGAAETLNELGSVNAPAGAFMVGLAAALSVYWMNKAAFPFPPRRPSSAPSSAGTSTAANRQISVCSRLSPAPGFFVRCSRACWPSRFTSLRVQSSSEPKCRF